MIIEENLFIPSKIRYVRGDKPDVSCILCAVWEQDPKVESLEVYRNERFGVCANLYPYSPGHLMIFPSRHVEDPRQLTQKEARDLFLL